MNQVTPRQHLPEAPLSAGARFIRGFKRLGSVLGVLAFLTGIAIAIVIANETRQSAVNRHIQAICFVSAKSRGAVVMSQYRSSEVDLGASGCPGPMYTEMAPIIMNVAANSPAPLEGFFGPLYIGSLISLGVGATVFASFWLVGWLCAGFTRD